MKKHIESLRTTIASWANNEMREGAEIVLNVLEAKISQPLQPVKSLQECKDEVAKKYGLSKFNSSYSSPEMDEAAELYASQFKTPPVQETKYNPGYSPGDENHEG